MSALPGWRLAIGSRTARGYIGGNSKRGDCRVQASREITTLLFTDIEGSTRLWEQEGEGMSRALAEHDKLSREAVEAHRGFIVKMTGDGM
ncbi:MAG TPA: adenylate/guanylate cyclase domain-containing protein, partial [Bryobacteraceae bacterium]